MNYLFLNDKLKCQNDDCEAKKVLWLPITSNVNEEYTKILEQRLVIYYDALKRHIHSIYKDLGAEKIDYSEDQVLEFTNLLISGINKCHINYLRGNVFEAQKVLYDALDRCQSVFESFKDKLESNTYWRIRKNKTEYISKEDFYHIPFNQSFLCKDDRFNNKGYPCLYLSFEEKGCKTEMKFSNEKDSLSTFQYTATDKDLIMLDLTKVNNSEYTSDNVNIIAHILWPLIASCYGISRYCREIGCECPNVTKNFKIEYVISQMFAEYVHYHLNLDGIIYYTVRNEHLDPEKPEMKNVVLFTNPKDGEVYDQDLLSKFNISII